MDRWHFWSSLRLHFLLLLWSTNPVLHVTHLPVSYSHIKYKAIDENYSKVGYFFFFPKVRSPENDLSLCSPSPYFCSSLLLSKSTIFLLDSLLAIISLLSSFFFPTLLGSLCHSVFAGSPPGGRTFWWCSWQGKKTPQLTSIRENWKPRQSHIVRYSFIHWVRLESLVSKCSWRTVDST